MNEQEQLMLTVKERMAANKRRKLVPMSAMAQVLHTDIGTLVVTWTEKFVCKKSMAITLDYEVHKIPAVLPEGYHRKGDIDFADAVLCTNHEEINVAARRKNALKNGKV